MMDQKPASEARHGGDQLYLFGHGSVLTNLNAE